MVTVEEERYCIVLYGLSGVLRLSTFKGRCCESCDIIRFWALESFRFLACFALFRRFNMLRNNHSSDHLGG